MINGVMAKEIERKFLVRTERIPTSRLTDGARFVQGYLSIEPVVRVRLSHRDASPSRAWLTVKGPGSVTRDEFEYEIPPDDAHAMVSLCVAVLHKTRWNITENHHRWELDQYHHRWQGLWLAEIELSHPDEPFERPDWLGDEVTDDPRFTNASIALGEDPHTLIESVRTHSERQ